MGDFDWIDGGKITGLENRAKVMRPGGQDGKDRIWWCDGEYVWFRRNKANPATLERHNNFVADGDYIHVETQNDIEIWQLRPQSMFHSKKGPRGKQLDISKLNMYDLRRQAALAACRRDWVSFRDIMSYLKERVLARHLGNTNAGDQEYAEQYLAVIQSIVQRDGPSAGEINRELMSLMQKGGSRERIITLGSNTS